MLGRLVIIKRIRVTIKVSTDCPGRDKIKGKRIKNYITDKYKTNFLLSSRTAMRELASLLDGAG